MIRWWCPVRIESNIFGRDKQAWKKVSSSSNIFFSTILKYNIPSHHVISMKLWPKHFLLFSCIFTQFFFARMQIHSFWIHSPKTREHDVVHLFHVWKRHFSIFSACLSHFQLGRVRCPTWRGENLSTSVQLKLVFYHFLPSACLKGMHASNMGHSGRKKTTWLTPRVC